MLIKKMWSLARWCSELRHYCLVGFEWPAGIRYDASVGNVGIWPHRYSFSLHIISHISAELTNNINHLITYSLIAIKPKKFLTALQEFIHLFQTMSYHSFQWQCVICLYRYLGSRWWVCQNLHASKTMFAKTVKQRILHRT